MINMTDEQKEKHKRQCLAYQRTLGQFSIKLKKSQLAEYKAAAEKAGIPFRAWVLSAMDEKIEG